MKVLAEDLWSKLPMADFRPRFFVETYIEKLSVNTPHFSQSRLMDVFSSCGEALGYISEYQSNEKNAGYILSALDEIDSCLSGDPVATDIFRYLDEPRANVFKKIRSGDLSSSQLNRLSVICRAIVSKEDLYSESLLAALRTSIVEVADLNQKTRLTANIYLLTGLYTTHLLNRGYSPTYLFNRAELFMREANYSGKNFQEQFDFVTERLRSYTTSHDVYFSIRAHKPSCLLSIEDDSVFTFSDVLPEFISGPDRDKLGKEFEFNVIVRSTIEATDYVTASWRVKDRLDKLLDAVTALELNPKIQVSSNCVVVSKHQNLTHRRSLNIGLLLGFLSSEGGTYFSSSESSIRHALAQLNEHGREKLGRSLRYLRLARESVSLEQKLLNLWISLESLFSDGESSILSNILEYVPQIYAVSALRRRVSYLRELLARNQVDVTKKARVHLGGECDVFNKDVTDAQIFLLLKDEAASIELFDSLGLREHLKFKLLSTFEEMKSNKTIYERVRRSEVDVARQLRRIYFLRNKIAHTGHYANIRPQLVTHLLDYLAVCYTAITVSAAKAAQDQNQSIDDLMSAYKMGAEVVVSRAQSTDSVSKIEDITPVPII